MLSVGLSADYHGEDKQRETTGARGSTHLPEGLQAACGADVGSAFPCHPPAWGAVSRCTARTVRENASGQLPAPRGPGSKAGVLALTLRLGRPSVKTRSAARTRGCAHRKAMVTAAHRAAQPALQSSQFRIQTRDLKCSIVSARKRQTKISLHLLESRSPAVNVTLALGHVRSRLGQFCCDGQEGTWQTLPSWKSLEITAPYMP